MTNATWKTHPHDGNFDNAANWSGGQIPDGTASFGASSITSLSFSLFTTSGKWLFEAGASHYKFDVDTDVELDFTGAGIVIQGGAATITDEHQLSFHNHSSAGTAHITVSEDTAELDFFDTSTAGKAQITNDHTVDFHGSSSAGSAKITTNSGLIFDDNSTAGKAHIVNTDVLNFFGQSSAGHAVITTVGLGDDTYFRDSSTADNARLIANTGSLVDFHFHNGTINVGSIEGGGNINLGANILNVGGNDRSTTLSGNISGVDGSLTKAGTGTLTLSHAHNAYTGGTVIDAGTLDVAAVDATGTGAIAFDFLVQGHKTLKIENAALSNGNFDADIQFFGGSDKIDLSGLKFVAGANAHYDPMSGQLEIDSGNASVVLTLFEPASENFKVAKDAHGGTNITVVLPHEKANAIDHVASHRGEGSADSTAMDAHAHEAHAAGDFIL